MTGGPIAIVGMAGRYPGADDVAAFWDNLASGRECLTTYTEAELRAAGLDERLVADPRFVPRSAVLEGYDRFDAAHFGFSPREAMVKSPQQRVLLEVAHAALEDAGHAGDRFPGRVGVFVGGSLNPYEWLHLLADRQIVAAVGEAAIQVGNDLDYLATSIAWKLDLRGPGVNVQSACSTSLLAVHLAVRSLQAGECDLALAGGVSIRIPLRPGLLIEAGYVHQPGGIWSSDGYTRTFDARADGTVFGSGAGVVALRPLAEAVADGDAIHAVILGSAANNDGAAKVGYAAPSVDGQTRVIADALAEAGVSARTIGYVEAHGTATAIGDPIEVAGLTQAFRAHSADVGWCRIGSVKSNIGHLSAAAGVAGLSKAALALHRGLVPRTLHYETPNPRLDLAASPFRVAASPADWPAGGPVRRAGVSAFGIGGTNVHVVLEEAPAAPAQPEPRPWHVLPLSASTPAALEAVTDRLEGRLAEVADVSWTLQVGRSEHRHRRAVVCRDGDDALATMASRDPRRMLTGAAAPPWPGAAFLFPGQGTQHAGMGAGLHAWDPVFRAELDRCCDLVAARTGADLRALLFAPPERAAGAERELARTALTQPALFAVEYALARLWMAWGLRPRAMIGHSVGEYVAAALAGVFELEAAVGLVVERGRLVQELPPGAMLAVPLPEDEVVLLLGPGLDLAAVNGPRACVVSGPEAALDELAARLEASGVAGRRLRTSHAFHSAAMEPALEPLAAAVARARPRPPAVPFVSNVTGTWITDAEATDPGYWARHLRHAVRFGAGLAELLAGPGALLEVGPGQTLSGLARQQPAAAGRLVVPSLGPPHDATPEPALVLGALARCWLAGAPVDWAAVQGGEPRRRVHLPTYPFERQRHWVDRPAAGAAPPPPEGRLDVADWFWLPSWRQAPHRSLAEVDVRAASPWLLLADEGGVALRLAGRLRELGAEVAVAADQDALLAALREGPPPRTIVHAWSLGGGPVATTAGAAAAWRFPCFDSLVLLAQALTGDEPVRLAVVTDGVLAPDAPAAAPVKATLLGPCRVIPRELPHVTCQVVDVDVARLDLGRLVAELAAADPEREVAHRGGRRWVAGHEPVRLGERACRPALRERGVYLVTGGLGGIGGVVAEHLAAAAHARLVLVGRTPVAPGDGRVRRLEELGAEVLALAADVADPAAMGSALTAAEARFGPVHGVVHAAGVPGGGIVLRKDLADAAAVLRPKVTGTAVLWSLLAGRELDFLVLCSSIISPLGSFGQVDYCAANAFLDAFAASREGPVVSVAWDGWEDVGMLAGAGRRAGTAVGHPLVQRRMSPDVYASRLGPGTTWVLDDHRIAGRAVLPGTAYLEMARAAWCAAAGAGAPVELRDVVFLRPLSVADGETADVEVTLADGRFVVRGGGVEHATGTVMAGPPGPARVHDLASMRARCRARADLGGSSTGLVAAGPRWDVVREVRDGDGEAVALLELPEAVAGDLGDYWLHPALLDVATAFWLAGTGRQGRYLPLGYGSVVTSAPLPRRIWSAVRWRPGDPVSCDVTLMDESGAELARAEGFLLREVDAAAVGAAVGQASPPAAGVGIRPHEGVEALLRVLGERPGPCVVVSTRDLRARLAAAAGPPAPVAEAGPPGGERAVATPYAAPGTEVEQSVAALWAQVLGIERIGADDDFFELGGNSLVAIQLAGRVRDGFEIEFGIQHVLERPTIRGQAELVEERLVRRLESMSDDEVRALLEDRGPC